MTDSARYGAGRFGYVGDLRRPVLVLHTIEGSLSYRTAQRHQNPPHLWYSPSRRELYQTVDLRGPAFALRHPRGTPETNNRGPCLQVELEGFARDARTWPEAFYENIAQDVVRPLDVFCREVYGVTLVGGPSTRSLRYGDETDGLGVLASTRSPLRLSDQQWLDAHGVIGHQHVPDNTHWDPGGFRIDSLLSYLDDLDQSRVLQLLVGSERLLRGSDVREWQRVLVAFGLFDDGDVDGLFGVQTDAATRQLQQRLGLPADGIVTVGVAAAAAEQLERGQPPDPTLDLREPPAEPIDLSAGGSTDPAPTAPIPTAPIPTAPIPTMVPPALSAPATSPPSLSPPAMTAPAPPVAPAPSPTPRRPLDQPVLDLTGSGAGPDPAPTLRPDPTATATPEPPPGPVGAGQPAEPQEPSSLAARIIDALRRFVRSLFG